MISFRSHPHLDAVLFEYSGEFSMAEYLDGMRSFLDSELFRPGIDTLWDFRSVTVESVTPDLLKSVAAYNERLAPERGSSWKVALVVGADVAFGLSRMFAVYVESAPNEVMVFKTMDEAEAWLASG